MASIRIRVGAVLDSGATAVFNPLVAAAQRAARQITATGKQGAGEFAGSYRSAPAHAKRAFDETTRAAEKAGKDQAKAAEKSAKDQARAYEHVYQVKQRYLRQEERDAERAQQKFIGAARGGISSAGRTFGGIVRSGLGLAGEVARGAGVDFSVGSLVGRNVASRKTATDISNSGYVEGASGNVGTRQDPAKILTAAKEAADAAAISEDKALSGMQKFVGKSTDLQTGMEIVKQMSVLAKSGAGDLDDYMDAAGDVALKLGDIPNKGQAVVAVMKTMARQGQLGASEMRSFAKNVAPLIASAGMFAGGPAKAMNELGAVFQITKQFGGAKGPAQAAVSTSNFVSDLKTQGGLKALHAAGMKDSDIFADKGKTQLRALSEIIPRMLELTKGDLTKVAAEMKGKQSGRVLTGFQKVFSDAGGGAAGKAAVAGKFKEFGGEMSDKQVQESLAAAMETTESKAQLFQNRLQAIADDNLPRVIGSLEKLAPVAASVAEAFANFVAWASENPGKALGGALAASVAKAALGSVLEAGLSRALAGVGASGGLAIGTAAIAITAATLILSAASAAKDEGKKEVTGELSKGAALIQAAKQEYANKGSLSPETMAALQAEKGRLDETTQKSTGNTSWVDAAVAGLPGTEGTFTGKWKQLGEEHQARASASDVAMERKDIGQLLSAGEKHLSAAQALGESAKALSASAKALQHLLPPGGAAPGATTGPQPIR